MSNAPKKIYLSKAFIDLEHLDTPISDFNIEYSRTPQWISVEDELPTEGQPIYIHSKEYTNTILPSWGYSNDRCEMMKQQFDYWQPRYLPPLPEKPE